MNIYLMYPDRDYEIEEPSYEIESVGPLSLEPVFDAMAHGDSLVLSVCRSVLLNPCTDYETIIYRENILKDAFSFPEVFRSIYAFCTDSEQERRNSWCWMPKDNVIGILSSAVSLLRLYLKMFEKLRSLTGGLGSASSAGVRRFISMLDRKISDDFLEEAWNLLDDLDLSGSAFIGASFGSCLNGVDYSALSGKRDAGIFSRMFSRSFTIGERDDSALADLHARKERALGRVADILARSASAMEDFFCNLKNELAFYIGALNLRSCIVEAGMSLTFPCIEGIESERRSWKNLYDISLALRPGSSVIGNDLEDSDASVFIITGPNQGGKTTFLRSVGQAQLMMQCGLFVAAESFMAPLRSGVRTHFTADEDRFLKSGRLDEELGRMRNISLSMKKGYLLLMNESFSSTNEREGSLIAENITRVSMNHGIDVFSVTHLHEYAISFSDDPDVCFLKAERNDDGTRSFRMKVQKPEDTAYGIDIWNRVLS